MKELNYKYYCRCCVRMVVVVSIFAFLISCVHVNDRSLIKEAEANMENNPEYALCLLDSVKYFPHLNRKYKNLARYVRMFAYYKLDKEFDNFGNAFKLAKYYEVNKDINKASWLYFFSGKIAQKKQNFKDATIYLSEAIEFGQMVEDSNLLLNVYCTKGELYLQQYDKQAAINAYQQALSYKSLNCDGCWVSYYLGNCYLYTKDYKKAMLAYCKAEKEAIIWGNSKEAAQLLFNIGQSYHQVSDRDNALKYFRKSLSHTVKTDELRYRCYLAMAKEYMMTNQDSVLYFLNKFNVADLENLEIMHCYYMTKSQLEELRGKHEIALALYKQGFVYADSLWMRNSDERIDNIMLHYEKRKLTGKNLRLIHKQNKLYISICVLVLIVALVILFFKNLIRKKQLDYIQACSTAETLKHLYDEQKVCQDKFRTLLIEKLEISKKLALLSGQPLDKNKSFLEMYSKVVGERAIELDWTELYFTINFLYNNFHLKVTQQFAVLNEKEIQLCCLLRAGFKSDEIAFVIRLTIYSVHKRKTCIRKKLGLDEREDILEYLLKNIG